MQILVVAATAAEVEPLLQHFGTNPPFKVLITGVGMVATAFAMGSYPNINQFNLLLNLGIAGSFDRRITLGQVVEVTHDCLAELGAEDGEQFISIDDLGFGQAKTTATTTLNQLTQGQLPQPLRQVHAITVNKVHGHTPSIAQISQRLHPQLESMEGAAFFYACQQLGLAGLQIRAVSNYVERRNRANWQIGLAVKNLNTFAVQLLELLLTQ